VKRALITGITGQDGAYLAQFLLRKSYEVYGLVRRSSASDVMDAKLRWLGVEKDVRFIDGNLIDRSSLIRVIRDVKSCMFCRSYSKPVSLPCHIMRGVGP